MNGLRLYHGPETDDAPEAGDEPGLAFEAPAGPRFAVGTERPDVLSFAALVPRLGGRDAAPLNRAKALHRNRRCPSCGGPVVEPVVLNDGLRDGTGQYIPGTATLVGFHCRGCRSEWPVYGE